MKEKVLKTITAIRESFGASIAIFEMGNCYQLYEILKTIFPDAEAFDVGGHVLTKIDNNFYDIRGLKNPDHFKMTPIVDKKRIESFSKNKWTDERRKKHGNGRGN